MSLREDFLWAIAENQDDTVVRLVYADWLDEQGEYEEAERQRKLAEAMNWLNSICQKLNADCAEHDAITYDQLVAFGRDASAIATVNIEVNQILNCDRIVTAIRDQIPEFWNAWSIVTDSPLPPDVEQKCYYFSGFCCATEIYPDTHVAGPLSEEFLRNQDWLRQVEEDPEVIREQQADFELGEFDRIQDELEQDGP